MARWLETVRTSRWVQGLRILKRTLSDNKYLAGITLLGIYLRFQWIIHIPTQQIYDFSTYQDIATNISLHQGVVYLGQPVAFQGIGYPATLGYLYWLLGNNNVFTGKVFNVILSVLTLFIVYFILAKLTQKRAIILISYTIVALLPNYIAYNNVIATEVFFTFIFSLIILVQLCDFHFLTKYILLGFLIGIAALTKPFFLVYPVIVAITVFLQKRNLKAGLVSFLYTFVVMAIFISPWTYRNYMVFGRFIPVSYDGGMVLYSTNNSNSVNGLWMPIDKVAGPKDLLKTVNEILQKHDNNTKLAYELDAILLPEALTWIGSHPGEFIELSLLRFKDTFFNGAGDIREWTMNEFTTKYTGWSKTTYERNVNAFYALSDYTIYALSSLGFLFVILGLLNIIRILKRKDLPISNLVVIPTLNILFFAVIYSVFEGQPRYDFPILFLLVFCSAYCVDAVMQVMGRAGIPPTTPLPPR